MSSEVEAAGAGATTATAEATKEGEEVWAQLYIVRRDGSCGNALPVDKTPLTVGSGGGCDVRILLAGVDPVHCAIHQHGLKLVNYGHSGTVLNGGDVELPARLHDDDMNVFTVGGRSFILVPSSVSVDVDDVKLLAMKHARPSRSSTPTRQQNDDCNNKKRKKSNSSSKKRLSSVKQVNRKSQQQSQQQQQVSPVTAMPAGEQEELLFSPKKTPTKMKLIRVKTPAVLQSPPRRIDSFTRGMDAVLARQSGAVVDSRQVSPVRQVQQAPAVEQEQEKEKDAAVASPVKFREKLQHQHQHKKQQHTPVKASMLPVRQVLTAQPRRQRTIYDSPLLRRKLAEPAVVSSGKKQVKFGPALSPEIFDRMQPSSLPVKRGNTPLKSRRDSGSLLMVKSKFSVDVAVVENTAAMLVSESPEMGVAKEGDSALVNNELSPIKHEEVSVDDMETIVDDLTEAVAAKSTEFAEVVVETTTTTIDVTAETAEAVAEQIGMVAVAAEITQAEVIEAVVTESVEEVFKQTVATVVTTGEQRDDVVAAETANENAVTEPVTEETAAEIIVEQPSRRRSSMRHSKSFAVVEELEHDLDAEQAKVMFGSPIPTKRASSQQLGATSDPFANVLFSPSRSRRSSSQRSVPQQQVQVAKSPDQFSQQQSAAMEAELLLSPSRSRRSSVRKMEVHVKSATTPRQEEAVQAEALVAEQLADLVEPVRQSRSSQRSVPQLKPQEAIDSFEQSPTNATIKAVKKLEAQNRHSVSFRGVKQLMQEPKPRQSMDLRGVREMMHEPQQEQQQSLVGVRELMHEPQQEQQQSLVGVREMMHEPTRRPRMSTALSGLRELMQEPIKRSARLSVAVEGLDKLMQEEPLMLATVAEEDEDRAEYLAELDAIEHLVEASEKVELVTELTVTLNELFAAQTAIVKPAFAAEISVAESESVDAQSMDVEVASSVACSPPKVEAVASDTYESAVDADQTLPHQATKSDGADQLMELLEAEEEEHTEEIVKPAAKATRGRKKADKVKKEQEVDAPTTRKGKNSTANKDDAVETEQPKTRRGRVVAVAHEDEPVVSKMARGNQVEVKAAGAAKPKRGRPAKAAVEEPVAAAMRRGRGAAKVEAIEVERPVRGRRAAAVQAVEKIDEAYKVKKGSVEAAKKKHAAGKKSSETTTEDNENSSAGSNFSAAAALGKKTKVVAPKSAAVASSKKRKQIEVEETVAPARRTRSKK